MCVCFHILSFIVGALHVYRTLHLGLYIYIYHVSAKGVDEHMILLLSKSSIGRLNSIFFGFIFLSQVV